MIRQILHVEFLVCHIFFSFLVFMFENYGVLPCQEIICDHITSRDRGKVLALEDFIQEDEELQ